MRLVYSRDALADLVRLRAFIAEKDPASAARVAEEIATRMDNIRTFPDMGRGVDLAPDPQVVRDAVFGNPVVRYTVHKDAIAVLRIWHHFENR